MVETIQKKQGKAWESSLSLFEMGAEILEREKTRNKSCGFGLKLEALMWMQGFIYGHIHKCVDMCKCA